MLIKVNYALKRVTILKSMKGALAETKHFKQLFLKLIICLKQTNIFKI